MSSSTHVMVLSPHRDDAAFSCGLLLHGLLCGGCVVSIVNVCTVSSYAPFLSSGGGDCAAHVTDTRRDEDVAFIQALCSQISRTKLDVRLLDLGWRDLPLRWETADERALFPCVLPEFEVDALRRNFGSLPKVDIVLAPMALGGHIDHRLVLQAARQCFAASSLVFYEDLPYACTMSEAERRVYRMQLMPLTVEAWLPPGETPIGLKRKLASCYPSQISTELADVMERYSLEHGGRELFRAGHEAISLLKHALQQEGATS